MSKAIHAEPLDTEFDPVEEPAIVVESEPDALHSIPQDPTTAIDRDIAVTAQVQEDQPNTTVMPEAEPDLPTHEIGTGGTSSIKERDAVQDSSPSSNDNEVQPEAQALEETLNIVKTDSGVAAANVLPEALPSTVTLSFF